MNRIDEIKAVSGQATEEMIESILLRDAAFTVDANDGMGDPLKIFLYQDNTGVILHYFEGSAMAVPLHDCAVEYFPVVSQTIN